MSFSQRDYTSSNHLIIDSVRGYRQWRWYENKLISMRDTQWSKGLQVSECKKYSEAQEDTHDSPQSDCTCGFYAHYLPLESYAYYNNRVYGVIEASGRILMGTKGFRAEKARIVALAGLGEHDEWFGVTKPAIPEEVRGLVDFCTSIGVPYFPTVEKMVHEFPQVDLSSLGVPDLTEWEESIPQMKKDRELQTALFRKNAEEARKRDQARLDYTKKLSEQKLTFDQFKSWGFNTQREYETFKHLGGYS